MAVKSMNEMLDEMEKELEEIDLKKVWENDTQSLKNGLAEKCLKFAEALKPKLQHDTRNKPQTNKDMLPWVELAVYLFQNAEKVEALLLHSKILKDMQQFTASLKDLEIALETLENMREIPESENKN